MILKNQEIQLAKRPAGLPTPDTYRFLDSVVPSVSEGQILVKSLYISVDPYMRNRMNDVKSYVPPFALNQPIQGDVIAEVVESRNHHFKAGDFVAGMLDWALYSISDGQGLRKIDPQLGPLTSALNVLGLPGLTAYFGLLDIGQPKPGETVVVSGAAGAVGMVVGQIAKIKGCRVVGIAGTDEKCHLLTTELGFDEAVNYKTENLRRAVRNACPTGVDVYFDNVGGDVTDAVLPLINDFARVVLCGQIAMYNLEQPDVGPRNLVHLVIHRGLMKGFIATDYYDRAPQAASQLAAWLRTGKLQSRETIVEGFENVPDAFLGLFRGDNIGKLLVKVADAT